MIDAKLVVAILMEKFGYSENHREPSHEEKTVLACIDRLLSAGSDRDLSVEYDNEIPMESNIYEGACTDDCHEGQTPAEGSGARRKLIDQSKSSGHSVVNNDVETESMLHKSATSVKSSREPALEEDYDPTSTESFFGLRPRKQTKQDGVDFAYKTAAVSFSRKKSTGRLRKFSSVHSAYRKCTSSEMLRRWAKEVEKGGSREYKLHLLHQKTFEEYMKHPHGTLHDIDIQRLALEANQLVGLEGFRASGRFLISFKKRYDISSKRFGRSDSGSKKDEKPLLNGWSGGFPSISAD